MSTITDNTAKARFEMEENGITAFCDYRREGANVHLLHVEVPPEARGTGLAGRFMQAMMEHLRAAGHKAVPECAYAVTWLQKHRQEYGDLLAQ